MRMNRKKILKAISIPLGLLAIKSLIQKSVKKKINKSMKTILTDPYEENIAEIWTAGKRASLLNIVEIELRASHGELLARPLGSAKHFNHYDNLMFLPQPLSRALPLHETTQVDMKVILGPNAQKPLQINIPIMITGMAYGLALSEKAKRALAKGAREAGTAICSGEGPFLPEERKEAGRYILQISRWPWGLRTDEQIAIADMLEVQMGQGADMGSVVVSPKDIEGKARKLMGLGRDEIVSALPAPPGITKPEDWPEFMRKLRQRANGIPISLKIMAGRIEEDLAFALEQGFDAVVLDGAQAGTHKSPPIMQDDFGIPSIYALMKAVNFLNKQGVKDKISLIVSGGYFTPGSCLKALALGADAVYLGTAALYAAASKQSTKVTPSEPPTDIVFYPGKLKDKLNVNLASEEVANLLKAMVLEMEYALRVLGKTSIKQLDKNNLVALDNFSAELTGVNKV